MPFYKWNIAFSPLVQFACPTLEDARAIAEEAWTGLCWNEEGLDWRSGDQRVCETFWVFSVIGARFFSMSQSCKTERETCGKDCLSDVCESYYESHLFANIEWHIFIYFPFFFSWALVGLGIVIGVQFASWPHPLWRMLVPLRKQHGRIMSKWRRTGFIAFSTFRDVAGVSQKSADPVRLQSFLQCRSMTTRPALGRAFPFWFRLVVCYKDWALLLHSSLQLLCLSGNWLGIWGVRSITHLKCGGIWLFAGGQVLVWTSPYTKSKQIFQVLSSWNKGV